MDTSTFFIRLNGKVYGPVDNKQLATLVKRGQVDDKTEISKDKTSWQQLSSVPSFQAYYQKYLESKEESTTTGLTQLIPPQQAGMKSAAAPAPSVSNGWFVKYNGKIFGPLNKDQLALAIKKKHITQQAEVSKDQKSWQPLTSVPDFQKLSEYEEENTASVSGIFNAQAPPERTVQSSTEDFFARAGVAMEGDHLQVSKRGQGGFSVQIDFLKSKKFYTLAGAIIVLVLLVFNWTAVSTIATQQVFPWINDNVIHPGAAEERAKEAQAKAEREAKIRAEAEQKKREEEETRLAEEQAEKERLEAEALAEKESRKKEVFAALGKSLNCLPFPQQPPNTQREFVLAASESLWEYKDDVQVDFVSVIPFDTTIDIEKKSNTTSDTDALDEIRFVTIRAVTETETTPFDIASIILKKNGLILEWTKNVDKIVAEKINPLLFSAIKISSGDHEHYAGFFKPLTYRSSQPDSPALGKQFKIWNTPALQTLGASVPDYRLEIIDTNIATQKIPFAKPFALDIERADNDKCPVTFTKWMNFNEKPICGSFLLNRLPDEVQVSLKINRTETEAELADTNFKRASAEQAIRDWLKQQETKERKLKTKGKTLDEKIKEVDNYFLTLPFDAKTDKLTPYQEQANLIWLEDKKSQEEQWKRLKKDYLRLQQYTGKLRKLSEEIDSLENGPYRPVRFRIVIPLPVERKTKIVAVTKKPEDKAPTENQPDKPQVVQNQPNDDENNSPANATNSDKDKEDAKKEVQESESLTYIPVPSIPVLSVE